MKNTLSISITPRTVFVTALIVFGLYLGWQIRDLILVLMTSIVIAAFIENGTQILAKIRIPRFVSVVVMYLFACAILVAVLYVIVPVFLREIVEFVNLFPKNSQIAYLFAPLTNLVEAIRATGGVIVSSDPFYILARLGSDFSALGFLKGAGNVFGGLVNVLLIFVFSFYFAITERGVDAFLRAVVPAEHEPYALSLWHRTERKIGLWFRGQALQAVLVSIVTYIGLLIMGVPYALILSLLVFFAEFIPFGIILAAIPAILLAFLGDGFMLAIIVVVFYTVIQQLENYILQPYLVGRATGVPSIIVLIALITGVAIAGVYGLLLAIPVAVLILEIVRDRERMRMAQVADENISV